MWIDGTTREAFYEVLFNRRDVRENFLDKPIADDTLIRILTAAHHAPSVGFMQPWDFVVVKDLATRQQIKAAFSAESERAAKLFDDDNQAKYKRLKLEGICDSALGVVVTCDRSRSEIGKNKVVLGRTNNFDMDIYSTVCAVQNLWLAARAENIGMGWVSILDYDYLKELLGIPPQLEVIAYLCLGHVSEFADAPDLEKYQWRQRESLTPLIHYDKW